MLLIPMLLNRIRRWFKPRYRIKGEFRFDVYNADGSFNRSFSVENGDTTTGMNNMLDVYFNGGTAATTWYLGLIDNAGFSSVAASDTMASHSGWSESTAYSESTRPQWTTGSASGLSVTNASTVNFTVNAALTLKGAFVTSDNTKGGTSGILFATGPLSSSQTFSSGQVIKGTFTKTMTLS